MGCMYRLLRTRLAELQHGRVVLIDLIGAGAMVIKGSILADYCNVIMSATACQITFAFALGIHR